MMDRIQLTSHSIVMMCLDAATNSAPASVKQLSKENDMAAKKSKAKKQIQKQLKKLNARIKKMSKQIKGLQDAVDSATTDQIGTKLQKGSTQGVWPDPKFSADEVEIAGEMTEDAEEVEDILEKTDR